ncbi:YkgJ family cysteine cluster protein [Undibacterium sp. Ji67W]|uniref:YkgJ family cysteine cluster protein n=1 Tax=Undibacterium sp. Ji67W TaxID=3413042 RepID=UPI003BF2FE2F
MQPIKFRTIEEAKTLEVPKTSRKVIEKAQSAVDFVLNGNASRLIKVKAIFEAADDIIAEISPLSVCKKGCNYCCHIDVLITEIEAKYIEKNTGKVVRLNGVNNKVHGKPRTPCTLLGADGACSIYSYRPLVCRAFLTFDSPTYCQESSIEHVTYDSRGHPNLKNLGEVLIHLNNASGFKDIREYFPLDV